MTGIWWARLGPPTPKDRPNLWFFTWVWASPESSETYPYPRGLAGQEIVDFWNLTGPLLPQNPLEKVGGAAPTFSIGFCGRRGLGAEIAQDK